ncbi:chromosome segregation protein SMC [Pseudogemmobacter faecipullorum]|uniref:Chromosome partition protein Smc n=1 Tax=Pseudogemmobacter faecipullorum TaxID=2755041 RepID=A0ABS8CGY6_9RHOB|nr:chromosome segregation protein SMC [Pseudogemmobacter faecipullorum]MCB5408647.1 chromosome segregation protein SMC [Pseudogemmobacter faecipullorum]
MRFTKLRLNGFKSFVDPTDLVIHEGLTGVVGPNGCGKSNLLEALRWVMGENRPTAMRGAGMEDVIFNGAATRGARNFAEVALVLDNSDRLAPSGFNDQDQIEIVRRITRDAGSAYKANSKDVRARDVQMLFADASTGSHSPALVRQGQISELINARPKARRRVLEEAAGISGLYARRHEAELKLSATETNLNRVDDVLEQLAQQLSVLTRQARQAGRYREISEELGRAEGMLLWRRWHEADQTRIEAEEGLRARLVQQGKAETLSREAAKARESQEAGLPAQREEETIASAILQRLILQRDQLGDQEKQALAKIETLRGRIAQLGNDIEREAGLNRDAGEVIERLHWEIDQLQAAHDGYDERLEEALEASREASSVLTDRETLLSEATEDAARLAARHQSAARMVQESRAALERTASEAGRAHAAVDQAGEALLSAEESFVAAGEAREAASELVEQTEEALSLAEEARAEAQSREAAARAARSEAEGEASALRAEKAALARLVERETLAGHQILDRLEVEPGYEKALGAALSEDLRAPEVAADAATGWALLPGYDDPQPLPAGVAVLSDHVGAPEVLARRLGQIGLVSREEGFRLQPGLQPGQRLVSREGDLWRWDGFRAGAEDAPSAAALRLQQLNRLQKLSQDLEEASTRAEAATGAHEALLARLQQLARADQQARDARRAADQRLAESDRALSKSEAEKTLAAGRLEASRIAVARYEAEALAAQERLAGAEAGAAELPNLDLARIAVENARMAVEGARIAMMSRRSHHDELRREGEARVRRRQEATKELSGWRHRLETAGRRAEELAERQGETEEELAEACEAPEEIAARREELGEAIFEAEERRAKAMTALQAAEAALREAQMLERDSERLAGEAREARARAEARLEAAREAVSLAANRISEEADRTPQELLISLRSEPEKIPGVELLDQDVQRLKRQRDALGAVNLRAEEDAKAVDTEYTQLATEKGDLEEAVKRLRAGIQGLNKEGRERLLTAFEQVNANFSTLFTHLFGGGEARLVLVESDDPLEAGLEIMCQPPGKRLATLSLLSGGEQTLTALALIFGVFLANPAPICVLDEVDAPLDDANVTRFCDLMDEMTRRTDTRFLVITHHAVTMARMDRLFGVTMQEQGVSQLVSVDLRKAEELVA